MAEALMVVIIIVLSTIVMVWVVPVFTLNTTHDNGQLAYLESFATTQGNFVYSSQVGTEDTRSSSGPWTPNSQCTSAISSPFTGNLVVPARASCVISAKVTGNVFVQNGATLIVNGTSIAGSIVGNYSARVSLANAFVGTVGSCSDPPTATVGLYHIDIVMITGSTINGNLYVGDRGSATMTGSNITCTAEFEVNSVSTIAGNTIGAQLEAEADGTATVTGNTVCYAVVVDPCFDDDGNGAAVVAGNSLNGNISYGQDGWCASGGNRVTGTTSGTCSGRVVLNLLNTGSIPVLLRSVYVDSNPSSALIWTLGPGLILTCVGVAQTTPCALLPIVIPVGQGVQVTLTWTPPSASVSAVGLDVHVALVSSHSNFVDAHLYLGAGLTVTSQSRQTPRICPPCS